MNPLQLTGDLHQDFLSMRVSLGDVWFLFTGDAEAPTEAEMERRLPPRRQHVVRRRCHPARGILGATWL